MLFVYFRNDILWKLKILIVFTICTVLKCLKGYQIYFVLDFEMKITKRYTVHSSSISNRFKSEWQLVHIVF
jgi:hypothetical protein